MRRLWLLSFLALPWLAQAQGDVSPQLEQARLLMREGLERELPSPRLNARPEWPRAETSPQPTAPARPEPGEKRLESLTERARNDASLRARAVAEERRTVPDNQPGVGQSRTRAAKAMGPKMKPPKP